MFHEKRFDRVVLCVDDDSEGPVVVIAGGVLLVYDTWSFAEPAPHATRQFPEVSPIMDVRDVADPGVVGVLDQILLLLSRADLVGKLDDELSLAIAGCVGRRLGLVEERSAPGECVLREHRLRQRQLHSFLGVGNWEAHGVADQILRKGAAVCGWRHNRRWHHAKLLRRTACNADNDGHDVFEVIDE